jgi:succinate-semialdehyde dehydrogenase/glutarate-semialdehyde dehydrogenase
LLKDLQLLRQQAFVSGKWVYSHSGRTLEVLDPSTGQHIGRVPACDEVDTRAAIDAAGIALPGWGALTARSRAAILRRWHDLIIEHLADLALVTTLEQGKPLAAARSEILHGASVVQQSADEAIRVYGETLTASSASHPVGTRRAPVGVCAAITPSNFPSASITRSIAPALAAGCTVVLKPSPLSPFSALALAELAHRADLPHGVLNIVTGLPESIGSELTGNLTVRKLTFIGSARVGKQLLRQCAGTPKRVSMELDGIPPLIVFDDADTEQAVAEIVANRFCNGGQTFACGGRIYVHDKLYEEVASRLAKEVSGLRVGRGTEPGAQIGPLVSVCALRRAEAHLADALAKGAVALLGGQPAPLGTQFLSPTVLTNVSDDMLLAEEETAGPVASLLRFQTEAEVVRRAKDRPLGIAACIFTRDRDRASRVCRILQTGITGVTVGPVSTAAKPWAGQGSGHAVTEYLEELSSRLEASA